MDFLDIRYVKLQFSLRICEDAILPRHKVSAIRGGIGEMLLRMNCISDRDCDNCGFANECIVQRIMYAKGTITPKGVTEGESQGYVLECRDTKEQYASGEEFQFVLLLFGKNIVYFHQYLQAVVMLGQYGIGKNNSRFVVDSVTASDGEVIFSGNRLDMNYYHVSTVREYVNYRLEQLRNDFTGTILLQSPLALRVDGKLLTEFSLEAFYRAALRKVYMLSCFEGMEWDESFGQLEIPYEVSGAALFQESVPRYSNHKQQKMVLNGMKGKIRLIRREDVTEDDLFLQILLAGELLHIGRNNRFGFGKYVLK